MKLTRSFYVLAVFTLIAAFLTGCHGRRHGDDDFPRKMLERIDRHVEDLQLTSDQNDRYQDIRSRLEADLTKQRELHRAFRTELLAVIDNRESELKDVTLKLRTKTGDIPAMINLYLDYIDEFYDILDEQQQEMLMEEIRDKADYRRFRR